ncbi:putative IgGFc-binding protein [Apostichopus japonicus]|uniref:Putative IgGFc-binding protein n=1 Tax=Stichopus japonicus TaxID=307972 RepID=A0A2G8L0X7_STIJA|nr:putative IgGFc-binding protein [Apostichopus japonicus]
MMLLSYNTSKARSQAIFDRYEIQFEYRAVPGRRSVTSVASNLTASGTAHQGSRPAPTLVCGRRLYTLATTLMEPISWKYFQVLDMDASLADYTYLCLKMEKDPSANPDFEFVYGPDDEVTLCREIDFAGVPQIEYPEELQARSQAIFDGYEIQFEYAAVPGRRTVTSVASKLTASGTAPSRISASPDSRLWKATLYASNDAEGTSQLEVFPSVMISQDQAAQDFTPGGLLQFSIPVDLDMDANLADYTYLCLKMEKDPAANPDFEFVYGPDDEVTLCREIDFAGVPQTPVLDPLERRRQVEITDVSVNTTFMQLDKSSASVLSTVYYNMHFGGSTDVIEGEDVWMIRFFVSETDDGRGEKKLISTTLQGSAAATLTPDTDKTFKAFVSFEYTGLGPGTDYPYACVIFAKHPTTDVDITFSGHPTATECVELPEIIVESQQLKLPEVYQTCRLWGDPHQITFDTYGYTHQGDAEYIAVTTCFNEDESVPNFEIVVDNFRKKPSIPVTYIREHRLYYNNVVYALTHPDDVSVDVRNVDLMETKILTTDFGLTIRFDNMHNSDITLPERFMNKVCGLCGNYDGVRSNECHYRNGTLMNQHNEECKLIHADEWIFDTPDTPYPTDFQPALRQCDEGSPYLDMAMEHCSILTDSAGPLADCHAYVDPDIYFNTCKFDVCQLLPEVFFLCGSVETYIYACGRESNWQAGVGDWREVATSCEPPCKGNMTFDPRGPPCPPSCADPEGSSASCNLPTLEMCFCPEGTLLNGIECVPEEECGCKMASGRYLSIGEEFMKRDCSEYCTCEGNGDLQCHELSCAFNAQCAVKGGVRNCYCDDGSWVTVEKNVA